MICESIYLRENEGDMSVRLDTYVCKTEGDMNRPPRDAMVILPGGAYSFLAERESEPPAKAFLGAGFNVFTLYYSIGEPARFPRPLVDASLAIAHIRRNAERYNIDPDRIFVCGFSAGGHLAGSIGTFWNRDIAAFEGMAKGENRPHGVILSYPLVTLGGELSHELCTQRITGCETPTAEQCAAYSLEKQVSEDTVPHFIWQTEEDTCVPVENSLLLASALVAKRIPTELHIYPKGPHGMSVATPEEVAHTGEANANLHVADWVRSAIEWTKII